MLFYGFITRGHSTVALLPLSTWYIPPLSPSFAYSVSAEVPKLFNLCKALQPVLLPHHGTGQHTPYPLFFPQNGHQIQRVDETQILSP